MPDLPHYLSKITSQHNQKPKLMAELAAIVQPFVDAQAVLASVPVAYDLDTAVGAQLDVLGIWIGVGRNLTVPLTTVYFSFDTAGLGFDQGVWKGPFDPSDGLYRLDDDGYRTLLRAKIAANQWDGTVSGAEMALQDILPPGSPGIFYVVDNQDMTMIIGLVGLVPDVVTSALITGGYLKLVPAGVHVTYIIGTAGPAFGFDIQNSTIAGFDTGSWGA